MTKYFNYNSSPVSNILPPIFPDFSINSDMSKKMLNAKAVNGENYWDIMREVFQHDFETLPKDRFKVWGSVMSVPFMSNFKIFDIVSLVTEIARKDSRYLYALEDPMVGYGSKEDFSLFSMFNDFNTTMNRIQHMAHLIICGYTPEKLATLDNILELGAGIGEMTDIVYKLGFKGKYTIYDFPEVSNIQKYFHKSLRHNNVTYISDYNDLTATDLCIATWSFTEMPFDLREKIMSNIKDSKEWLMAYSNYIFGLDNEDYIKNTFLPNYQNRDINFIDIPSMPWDGGTKYLTVK